MTAHALLLAIWQFIAQAIFPFPSTPPPTGSSITLLVTTATSNAGGTTSDIDTTGATLIIIYEATFGVYPSAPTDNKSNGWSLFSSGGCPDSGTGTNRTNAWYAWNPTVGSGHNFTIPAGTLGVVKAYSHIQTSSDPADGSSCGGGDSGSGTTVTMGSITTTVNGDLVDTGIEDYAGVCDTIDSGFGTDNCVNAGSWADAHVIQSMAGSIAPTWTTTSADKRAAAMVAFKKQ